MGHHLHVHYGCPGIFELFTLGIIGLPVPNETLPACCGHLGQQGELHPLLAILAAFLGSCSRITVSYLPGTAWWPVRLVKKKKEKKGAS